jgi:protein-disulfide isomerase
LKHRNRKPRGNKTNYRKLLIMAVLFGALLIGGSITAFSNFGGKNKSSSSNPADTQQLISNLTTPVIPGAEAIGNDNATLNIIEFGDYQCPFCARFNQETKDQLIAKYVDTGVVRFGFKDLVINDLPKDKLSTLGAEASYCAAEQNKYWDYHDEVYRNSRGENTGWISIDSLVGFAKNVNMPNISQFTECLNSHKFNQLVAQNDMFAKGLGLGSTPTFLILKDNSTKIAALEGAQPIKVFDDVIAQFLNNTL